MRKSSATSSEGQRITNITSDSESRPVAQSCKCVPQKQLTCEQHFLPQLRVSALQNRASLQEQSLHCTRGLGPHHPLIRDWYDKRKSDETTVSSPLVVQQQQCSPTDLLSTSILAGLGGDIRNAKTSAETDIKADSDRQRERAIVLIAVCAAVQLSCRPYMNQGTIFSQREQLVAVNWSKNTRKTSDNQS